MKNINFSLSDFNYAELNETFQKFVDKAKEDNKFIRKVSILGIVSVVIFVVTFIVNDYQQGNIRDATNRQGEYQVIEDFLAKNQTEVIEYNKTVESIKTEILHEEDIDKAHAMVGMLAESNNILVEDSKKNEAPLNIGNGIMGSATEMNVKGTYINLMKFLDALENESFFISVDNVSLATDRSSSELTSKINYTIFFIPSNKEENGK